MTSLRRFSALAARLAGPAGSRPVLAADGPGRRGCAPLATMRGASLTPADGITTVIGHPVTPGFLRAPRVGRGPAYRPTSTRRPVADPSTIFWQDLMERCARRLTASGPVADGPVAGQVRATTLRQDWDIQFVVQVGADVRTKRALTLRVGANFARTCSRKRDPSRRLPSTIEKP